ncbi:MAG: PTS sugar transporter subunit IIA [Candidatus Latescibacterota bacterium]
MIKLSKLLSLDRIKILHTKEKTEALKEICQLLAGSESIQDAGELDRAIFERERIMSTSIGLGIAIPHVRLKSVADMTMAVGVIKEGINYEAFDDLPVNIIIMIAAPEGSHREYLSVLARLALLLKNSSLRNGILNAKNEEEIFEILKEH